MNAEIKTRIEMISKGEVPEGYKETKVGIIPEDWEVKKLGGIAEIIDGDRGKNYPNQKDLVDDGVLFLSTKNIVNSSFDFTDNRYITKEKFSILRKGKLQQNDLVITMRGSIGNVALFRNKQYKTAFINAQMAIIRPLNILSDFLWLFLNTDVVQRRIDIMSSGSAQPQLTKKVVKELYIAKSSYKEQQKIAQILSTWDQAIELKEKLIEEKKEQKKGLMQKLLTGEVRLPGFNGEWEEVRLGEVIFFPQKEALLNPQDYYLLTVKLHLNGIEATDKKPNKTKRGRPYYMREPKELLIGRQNFHNGGIGIVPDEMENYIASNAISTLKAKKGDIKFYYYYLSNANFYKRIGHIVGGTGQKEISEIEMKKLKLIIPKSLQEQKAIAQILTVADKEIDLLNQELEQLKLQKKGLMQLLLTGIIRVKS